MKQKAKTYKRQSTIKISRLFLVVCASALIVLAPFIIVKAQPSPEDTDGGIVVHGLCCLSAFCDDSMCGGAVSIIVDYHKKAEEVMIEEHIPLEPFVQRLWMHITFFSDNVLRAMQMMTEQLSAVALQQAFIVGTFFDAKIALETQRDLQELRYQAHKDYQPSESFCAFGTNVRSLSGSNSATLYNKAALDENSMKRILGNKNTAAAGSRTEDKTARWKKFKQNYCDPKDNNYNIYNPDNTGLQQACGTDDPTDKNRINIDVNYTKLIENPHTIKADFSNENPNASGEDIMALSANLYGHDILTRQIAQLDQKASQQAYMHLRSTMAKRNVALNSFNAITALKTSGTLSAAADDLDSKDTAKFMGIVLKDLGIPEEEITLILGENPSYYAQLEILSKKISQSPEFYSDLYDKPANVARKSAALKALELMIEREIYNSQIRREMLLSVLLSSKLDPEFERVQKQLGKGK